MTETTELTAGQIKQQERADEIQGLRDLADFLEQHPAVPMPYLAGLNSFAADLDEIRAATHLTGEWDKQYQGGYVVYARKFGPVVLDLNITRDKVCRRVQVGVEHVPAVAAHDKPVYEWDCTGEPGTAEAAL